MAYTTVGVHIHDPSDISVSTSIDGSTVWLNLGDQVAVFAHTPEVAAALQRAVTTLRGIVRKLDSDNRWESYKRKNPA